MSELSHFEELSTKTPVTQPYAIITGAVVLVFVLWLLNYLAPTETVKELKNAEKARGMVTQTSDDGEEI